MDTQNKGDDVTDKLNEAIKTRKRLAKELEFAHGQLEAGRERVRLALSVLDGSDRGNLPLSVDHYPTPSDLSGLLKKLDANERTLDVHRRDFDKLFPEVSKRLGVADRLEMKQKQG